MRTQSIDTSPETEQMLVKLLRKAPMWERFRLVQSLTQGALWSYVHIWQESHHNISESEAASQVISSIYGTTLARCVQGALAKSKDWRIQTIDLMTTMLPLMHLFEELNIPCYLGGSIASSLYGMQQLANDIDLIVDLDKHMLPLLSALPRLGYVFDENDIQRAFYEQTSFSILHLNSLLKIDVIIPKQSTFDIAMLPLVIPQVLDRRYPPVRIASVAEMLLFKLHRYHQRHKVRKDGMNDDAEWNDVLGMLKVQGLDLNFVYLESLARTFGMMETWQQALTDAGLKDS
jgi:hypothetical protein